MVNVSSDKLVWTATHHDPNSGIMYLCEFELQFSTFKVNSKRRKFWVKSQIHYSNART